MKFSRLFAKAPRDVANLIAQNIDMDGIDKIEIAGPGFINFFMKNDSLQIVVKKIISEGKAVSYHGSFRFGQYLDEKSEEITGNTGCMSLSGGTLTEKTLNEAPYLDCISFSGIQIDLFNDYLGGEVRLAYYHDGEKVIPVTGISISGSLKEALSGVTFSKGVVLKEYYEVPEKALIKGMKIL